MRILHEPYGIEDPYRPAPVERVPRDPRPGEPVEFHFRSDPGAAGARVTIKGPGGEQVLEARDLGDGQWYARLESATSGTYSYGISSAEASAGPWEFEVGTWHEAASLASAGPVDDALRLVLEAVGGARATLTATSSETGAVRLELETGVARAADPERHSLSLPGLELAVDPAGFSLLASAPGSPDTSVRLPLSFRWLALEDGSIAAFEAPLELPAGQAFYGLGERFGTPDLRGRRTDVRVYEEYKEQGERTYLPVPFLVSSGSWGVWLEEDEPSFFDLTDDPRIELPVSPPRSRTLKLHLILADEPYGVTATFTRLTGEMSVPPKWSFGPWMSANTWNSQAITEAAIDRTVSEDIPATVLVIEAWSDESTFYIFNDAQYEPAPGDHVPALADFTFGGRWPDPKGMIDRCHELGIRVVLWQIPVMKKLEEPHAQHDANEAWMMENGFGIREEDGAPYRNRGWWFPDALVIDFSNPKERDWWFAKRNYLFSELGIDGMKTDGGEHLWGSRLCAHDGRRGSALVNTYSRDYSRAYHEFVQRHKPGDSLVFSRAGYTGSQSFPGHWAGDENSTWAAYRASILAGVSAGVSGISIWGWDLGGFSGEVPTTELYLRSTAMAALCPVMQYHSESHGSADNRERTPWNVAERNNDQAAIDTYRSFARLRMRLLDWLAGEAEAMSAQGLPLMRSPALAYPDEHDRMSQDPFAYLFGRDLLVCPVVEKGALLREAHLPAGEWLDAWSGSRFEGGVRVSVPAPLERIPVFVRADSPRAGALLEAFGKR